LAYQEWERDQRHPAQEQPTYTARLAALNAKDDVRDRAEAVEEGALPVDPLALPCTRCGAAAGAKCTNYKKQPKQTCPGRGLPQQTAPQEDAGACDDAAYEDQCAARCGL
jgi:hypothetical protein